MQDEAPTHKLLAVRQRLAQVFGNRVAAIYHVVEWPPQSQDLTSCDFFLWGYLEVQVFATLPLNLDDLHRGIELEFEGLTSTNLI